VVGTKLIIASRLEGKTPRGEFTSEKMETRSQTPMQSSLRAKTAEGGKPRTKVLLRRMKFAMSTLKTAYRLINCEEKNERYSRECVKCLACKHDKHRTSTAAISKK
jgi:muramidase (phage lysozyme)